MPTTPAEVAIGPQRDVGGLPLGNCNFRFSTDLHLGAKILTWSAATSTRRRRWGCCASMRRPRSRRCTVPSRSFRSDLARRSAGHSQCPARNRHPGSRSGRGHRGGDRPQLRPQPSPGISGLSSAGCRRYPRGPLHVALDKYAPTTNRRSRSGCIGTPACICASFPRAPGE